MVLLEGTKKKKGRGQNARYLHQTRVNQLFDDEEVTIFLAHCSASQKYPSKKVIYSASLGQMRIGSNIL